MKKLMNIFSNRSFIVSLLMSTISSAAFGAPNFGTYTVHGFESTRDHHSWGTYNRYYGSAQIINDRHGAFDGNYFGHIKVKPFGVAALGRISGVDLDVPGRDYSRWGCTVRAWVRGTNFGYLDIFDATDWTQIWWVRSLDNRSPWEWTYVQTGAISPPESLYFQYALVGNGINKEASLDHVAVNCGYNHSY